MLFYHRSTASPARIGPELRIFMPAVLRTGRKTLKRHKKFKKYPNDVNPSRGVILCDIFARENTKLGILPIYQKNFHENDLPCSRFYGF